MSLDWESFLQRHGVAYTSAGHHDVRLACPWCRDDGHPNLVVSLRGRGWKCWANPAQHRGRAAPRLMVALTGISLDEAKRMCGEEPLRHADDLVGYVHATLTATPPPPGPPQPLALPSEFKPLAGAAAAPFVQYLEGRGFARARIARFTTEHDVYYCRRGRWRYRIVFAITQRGQLWGWTGRSISPNAELRYLAAGIGDGAVSPTATLPWLDQLTGGRQLLLCEGPFDALRLRELGEHATCCFTAAPGRAQIDLLREVLPRYRRGVLLLDRDTWAASLAAQRALAEVPIRIVPLRHRKDPGEIESRQELDSILGQA